MENNVNLKYISTRNKNKTDYVSASKAIIKGIANDGGLFVPEDIPRLDVPLERLAEMTYVDLACTILRPWLTNFTDGEIRECVQNAYGSGFDDERIAPIRKAGDNFFLELFHGRTIAFKDMALSLLPHLMKTSAKKQGLTSRIAILTATSGDTGKAALAGFAEVDGVDIIVFYPEDGVSEIQKLQMVTQEGANTHVIGIRGNFDDAQNGVKAIFADKAFNDELAAKGFVFSSANSINIGRLVPQIVYYYYAYLQMMNAGEIKAGEPINFCVPTGNFGNILAGWYAKEMGLPVGKLICASNSNKVLYDFFTTNKYDISEREFILTSSPSMDILISSNLERLLYGLLGQDGEKVGRLMKNLSASRAYETVLANDCFAAEYADEDETFRAIREVYKTGYVIDTHTAVACAAYGKYKKATNDNTKTVITSTASPYKFAVDVCNAIDGTNTDKQGNINGMESVRLLEKLSGVPIPNAIKDIDKKPVLHDIVCDSNEMKIEVEKFLVDKTVYVV